MNWILSLCTMLSYMVRQNLIEIDVKIGRMLTDPNLGSYFGLTPNLGVNSSWSCRKGYRSLKVSYVQLVLHSMLFNHCDLLLQSMFRIWEYWNSEFNVPKVTGLESGKAEKKPCYSWLKIIFIFQLLSFIWIYFRTDLLNIYYESVTMLNLKIFRVVFIKRGMFYHPMLNLLYIYWRLVLTSY